jgi:hypothetical protein
MSNIKRFSSRKEVTEFLSTKGIDTSNWSKEKWLKLNKGQAEIHLMALAESMWDSYKKSKPEQLEETQWHIPFKDKITNQDLVKDFAISSEKILYEKDFTILKLKISIGMCARTSYTIIENEPKIPYFKFIEIYDKMRTSVPFHESPFEHCARVMTNEEYESWYSGEGHNERHTGRDIYKGWCRNFRGFIQYRELLENVLLIKNKMDFYEQQNGLH